MILHIDQRPAHINMFYQPQVEVVGDISYSLRQIQYCSDAKEELSPMVLQPWELPCRGPWQQSLYIRKGRYFRGCFPPECPLHYRMPGGLQ